MIHHVTKTLKSFKVKSLKCGGRR